MKKNRGILDINGTINMCPDMQIGPNTKWIATVDNMIWVDIIGLLYIS